MPFFRLLLSLGVHVYIELATKKESEFHKSMSRYLKTIFQFGGVDSSGYLLSHQVFEVFHASNIIIFKALYSIFWEIYCGLITLLLGQNFQIQEEVVFGYWNVENFQIISWNFVGLSAMRFFEVKIRLTVKYE